mmetsp:Transcript_14419/g.34751  ORF Transcript_14419/g.34751 Transcript_14419/m.34751 type:complete len:104 (-) Transcript_14419:893-1204(-)
MKTQTALLFVVCYGFYRAASLSSSDLQGFSTSAQQLARDFAADPVKEGTAYYVHLEKTGAIRWLCFALAAKGISYYFQKKRASKDRKAARLEAEAADIARKRK